MLQSIYEFNDTTCLAANGCWIMECARTMFISRLLSEDIASFQTIIIQTFSGHREGELSVLVRADSLKKTSY